MSFFAKGKLSTGKAHRKPKLPFSSYRSQEEGQGIVEAAAAFLFLLMILLAMFEMAIVFSSYIALLNTSIQGAIFAAGHPTMESSPPDEDYEQYISIMRSEAVASGLSWTGIGIEPPALPTTISAGEPLTVTIRYSLTTFASEIVFPFFGRFGLPTQYHIRASSTIPIR